MTILKISKTSLILVLLFMLQLGACAEEATTSTTQENEQLGPAEQPAQVSARQSKEAVSQEVSSKVSIQSTSTVSQDLDLAKIANKAPEVKKVSEIKLDEEKTVIAMNDLPASSQVSEVAEEQTAAQAMLNLEQYRGKVVYLDFWASWCVPCQQTFPWMDAMQKKYPDDIVFVAVNFGESPDDTVEFLKRFPADIKFIYDPLVQIASEYDIPGLPYSFIYGRKGELLGKHAGFSGGSEINLEAALKNLFESGE